MKRFLFLLLAIAGSIGTYFAVGMLLWQHQLIQHSIPVPAQILSAEIRRHSGKNTTYSPEITYRYTHQGQSYTSSLVMPFSPSSSRTWAKEIVDRYGGPTNGRLPEASLRPATAYVNPANPAEAILERNYSFVPYLLTMIGGFMSLVGFGLFLHVIGGGRSEMAAIALDDSETRLLLPTKSLEARTRDSMLWLAGAAVLLLPLAMHWTFFAREPLFLLLVFLALAVLTFIAYLRWTLTRHLSDVRLRVRPAPMVRGQPFALEMEADAFSPLRINSARAHVRCIEHYREQRGNKTSYGTRTKGERTATFCGACAIPAGGLLTGTGEVAVEADGLPPTSQSQLYPYYTWQVRVEIDIEQHADYAAIFPLVVV